MTHATAGLLLVLAAVPAAHASPEHHHLDPVVVEGVADAAVDDKSGIALDRMPLSVQSLDHDELAGAGRLADVMRAVPSQGSGPPRHAMLPGYRLQIRGFGAALVRNGMRQRRYADADPSSLSNVERIDVFKGPWSVLYGQAALGGLLSITTKRPQARFAAETSAIAGTDRRRQVGFDLTGPLGERFQARLTGEVERSGSHIEHLFVNRDNLGWSFTWQPAGHVQVHAVSEYVERETLSYPGLPVQGTARRDVYLGEPFARPLVSTGRLWQVWAPLPLPAGWTLTPRYQRHRLDTGYTRIQLGSMLPDGRTVSRSARETDSHHTFETMQLDLQTTSQTGPVGHRLLIGLESSRERSRTHEQMLSNIGPVDAVAPIYTYPAAPVQYGEARTVSDRLHGKAVYVQDVATLVPGWDMIAGVRRSLFDFRSLEDGEDAMRIFSTSWQIATHLQLSDTWSAFCGLNTGLETEGIIGQRAADGTAFEPERSRQWEAGLRHDGRTARATLSLFQLSQENGLTADPDHPDHFLQTWGRRVRGMEAEGRWRPGTSWTVAGGFVYLKSMVTASRTGTEGSELANTPRRTLTARAEWVPGGGWTVRGSVQHIGSRLLSSRGGTLPAFTVLNLAMGRALGQGAVELAVDNVLDRRYDLSNTNPRAVVPGPPREVMLKMRYAL